MGRLSHVPKGTRLIIKHVLCLSLYSLTTLAKLFFKPELNSAFTKITIRFCKLWKNQKNNSIQGNISLVGTKKLL